MGRHREFDLEHALDAAVSVFWEKGYEGTSYDDLTRVTGVARPSLYAAFGNKESLFRLALDRYSAVHLSFLDTALQKPKSRDVVRLFLEGTVDVTTSQPGSLGCLGVNCAVASSDTSEPSCQEVVARRSMSEEKLRSRLERAKAEGDLPASANCAALAGYVATISHGLAVQAKGGVCRDTLLAIVQQVLQTWPS